MILLIMNSHQVHIHLDTDLNRSSANGKDQINLLKTQFLVNMLIQTISIQENLVHLNF
jgi:hypothetical protein